MEMNKLKFKYRSLLTILGALAFFPAMFGMLGWAAYFDNAGEINRGFWMLVLLLVVFPMQVFLNQAIVYFSFRPIFMRKLSIDKSQFWRLYIGRWYPRHWYR